jgi:hypothetical protein
VQDYMGYLKLARSLASENKLALKFEQDQNMPRTDGATLFVPQPQPTFSAADWHIWNDALWHEIGHNMPENRDIFPILQEQKIDTKSVFGMCLNITDDYRVDKLRCNKYYGMREAASFTMPIHIRKIAGKMMPGELGKDENLQIITTMLAFDMKARGEFLPALRGMESILESKFEGKCSAWFSQLCDEYLERYAEAIDGESELETLRDIFTNVFKIPPESKGDGQGKGKGKPEEGEGKQGKGEAAEPNADGEEQEGESKGAGTIKYEDLIKHSHDAPEGAKGSPVKIEYEDHMPARPYVPHTDSSNKIIDYTKGESCPDKDWPGTNKGAVGRKLAQLNIDAIVGQARRLLQVETRKRPNFNQKAGRLDTSKLYRVTLPESSVSEKLFKTKQESKALDTAVSVLVDFSGSMQSMGKITTAIAAAVALEKLFKTLRVNCEILGFTEASRSRNITFVFKTFGRTVTEQFLVDSMVDASNIMVNNCDGDSIVVAHNRLIHQREPRKVLLVLSDGSPAGGTGDIDGFTKRVIKDIEASKEVDILGIGIADRNVERLYKHNRVVDNVENLPQKLIETLEDVLLGRKV